MLDFVDSYGYQEMAMAIVRTQFKKAGLVVSKPTRESLLKVIDLLAEVERDFRTERDVTANIAKRKVMVEKAK